MKVFLVTGSFIMGVTGALFVSRYAFRLGLVDLPNERSSQHYILCLSPTSGERPKKIKALEGGCLNVEEINSKIINLQEVSRTGNVSKIKSILKELVPEYRPQSYEHPVANQKMSTSIEDCNEVTIH